MCSISRRPKTARPGYGVGALNLNSQDNQSKSSPCNKNGTAFRFFFYSQRQLSISVNVAFFLVPDALFGQYLVSKQFLGKLYFPKSATYPSERSGFSSAAMETKDSNQYPNAARSNDFSPLRICNDLEWGASLR
jgi:hypothetical protein